jgi:hypothetical protein
MQLQSAIAFQLMITLEKLMNKLMSSLVAATLVGAFSLSAVAAETAKTIPAAAATAEKPAAAPKKAQEAKKHVVKAEEKKGLEAAAPAAPAKK